MRLVQIVPELPPALGGVGDYAFLLARELQRLDIATTFVVLDGQRQVQAARRRELREVSLWAPRAGALMQRLDALRPDAVLVHYSGYGYAKRGAPLWLVQGLRRWTASAARHRLITMFHELYATSAPWRSAFWLSPFARRIARSVLGLSDAYVTNLQRYRDLLEGWRPDLEASAVLPVFSNVGEAERLVPLAEREPIAVVFGQAPGRRRVYERFDRFRSILEAAGVEQILDIGPGNQDPIPDSLPLSVARRGRLEPEEVSRELSRSRFGLLDYPSVVAGKSGSLAAYMAHGLVCLNAAGGGKLCDGLQHGVNFLVPDADHTGASAEPNALQRVAEKGHRWYQQHDQKTTAKAFAAIISRIPS